jgi:hypothetical protein
MRGAIPPLPQIRLHGVLFVWAQGQIYFVTHFCTEQNSQLRRVSWSRLALDHREDPLIAVILCVLAYAITSISQQKEPYKAHHNLY